MAESWEAILFPSIGSLLLSFGMVILWKMWGWKNHYQLRPRTPKLLLCSGVGNLIVILLICFQQVQGFPCTLGLLADYSLFSFVFTPYILRALHYRIWHCDFLRRTISWTLTGKFKIIFLATFAVLHYTIMLCCMLFFETYSKRAPECTSSLDFYYLFVVLVSFLCFTAYLVSRIPLRFDAFGIVREFQLCLLCWLMLGGTALAIAAFASFWNPEKKETLFFVHSLLQLVMNSSTFYISIVRPTLGVKRLKAQRRSGYLANNSLHSLYIPQDTVEMDRHKPFGGPHLSPKSSAECMPGTIFGFQSFDELFADKEAAQKLRDLAQARFCLEMTEFLQAAYKYRKMNGDNLMDLHQAYLNILQEFIVEGSPYEVNIQHKMRDAVCNHKDLTHFVNFTCEGRKRVFDDSVHEVENLVMTNLVQPCGNGQDWRPKLQNRRSSFLVPHVGLGALTKKLSPSFNTEGGFFFRSREPTGASTQSNQNFRMSFSNLPHGAPQRRHSVSISPELTPKLDDSRSSVKSNHPFLSPRYGRCSSRVAVEGSVGAPVGDVHPAPNGSRLQRGEGSRSSFDLTPKLHMGAKTLFSQVAQQHAVVVADEEDLLRHQVPVSPTQIAHRFPDQPESPGIHCNPKPKLGMKSLEELCDTAAVMSPFRRSRDKSTYSSASENGMFSPLGSQPPSLSVSPQKSLRKKRKPYNREHSLSGNRDDPSMNRSREGKSQRSFSMWESTASMRNSLSSTACRSLFSKNGSPASDYSPDYGYSNSKKSINMKASHMFIASNSRNQKGAPAHELVAATKDAQTGNLFQDTDRSSPPSASSRSPFGSASDLLEVPTNHQVCRVPFPQLEVEINAATPHTRRRSALTIVKVDSLDYGSQSSESEGEAMGYDDLSPLSNSDGASVGASVRKKHLLELFSPPKSVRSRSGSNPGVTKSHGSFYSKIKGT